jgi:hypothetical protein
MAQSKEYIVLTYKKTDIENDQKTQEEIASLREALSKPFTVDGVPIEEIDIVDFLKLDDCDECVEDDYDECDDDCIEDNGQGFSMFGYLDTIKQLVDAVFLGFKIEEEVTGIIMTDVYPQSCEYVIYQAIQKCFDKICDGELSTVALINCFNDMDEIIRHKDEYDYIVTDDVKMQLYRNCKFILSNICEPSIC